MSLNELLNYDYNRIAFWLIITAIVIIATIAMVVLGFLWLKVASRKQNIFYGYKTVEAKNNQEAWKYVNLTIGRLWLTTGVVIFFLSIWVMLRCMHGSFEEVAAKGLVMLFIVLLFMLFNHFIIKTISKKKFGS